MTDFNVDPPTAMFGMAKAKDTVKVDITWVLQRQTPQPTAALDSTASAHREALTKVLQAYENARAALAKEDLGAAQKALADTNASANALASLDAQKLNDAAQAKWAQAAGSCAALRIAPARLRR